MRWTVVDASGEPVRTPDGGRLIFQEEPRLGHPEALLSFEHISNGTGVPVSELRAVELIE